MSDSTRKLLVVEDDVGLQRQLKWRFETFEVMFYEEVDAPEAVARIVARRTRSS